MEHFSEALTGETEPIELEELSSSDPTVAILASVGVIAAIATVVDKFLQAWERIEKIRKIRAELAEIGMIGKNLEELDDRISTTVSEVVEESIQITLEGYTKDGSRRNELETALRQDTTRLFGQIERGLKIHFRAEPKADANEADKKALEAVNRMSREMEFPQIEHEPMLLTGGQILEGEIPASVSASRKPTKTTTKRVNREAKKETKSGS